VTVKQQKDGKWLCRVDKTGIPRVSRSFLSKVEAEAFEREYLTKYLSKRPVEITDVRKLTDLIELWAKYHGLNLSDVERRKKCLLDLAYELGNPVAAKLSAEAFVTWRYERLKAGLSDKSMNNRHGYLCAVFNKLHKLKVIDYRNPIADVDFIKTHERQLSYLSRDQITLLLDTIASGCDNQSTYWVAQICLRTGARWGEAEQLKFKQLHNGRITFEFTKSKKTRTVPLNADFYKDLLRFAGFKNPDDRLFDNCIGAFRRAVKRSGLNFPVGQCSHILRHSFASHFVMNGGNILTLQKILGHADITMTMRYAHLAPDHLNDAIRLNPVDSV
jgi:integrase